MPELPEVHTITTDLKKHIENSLITDIQVLGEYKLSPDNQEFIAKVKNKKIVNVFRIAKNIVLELESEEFILIHLAMTGQVLFRIKDFRLDKWIRVIFHLQKNGKDGELRFTDMRMFGKVKLIDKKELPLMKEKYGPDPIEEQILPEQFLQRLKAKKTTVKNALLDQKIISGIGNIYATDSLWMAKIHPEVKTGDIDLKKAERLIVAVTEILKESILHRGSTLSDQMYVDIFGRVGAHQNFFRIYGKKTCPECNNPTSFKKINGRGTYFCMSCQKL